MRGRRREQSREKEWFQKRERNHDEGTKFERGELSPLGGGKGIRERKPKKAAHLEFAIPECKGHLALSEQKEGA